MAGTDPERKIFPETPRWQPTATEALLEVMAQSQPEDSYFAALRLQTGAELGYKYIDGLMRLGFVEHMSQDVVDALPRVRGRQPHYLKLTPAARVHMLEAINDRIKQLQIVAAALETDSERAVSSEAPRLGLNTPYFQAVTDSGDAV